MKLILSSCDVGNPASKQVILENLEKPIDRCKVWFFPNEHPQRKILPLDAGTRICIFLTMKFPNDLPNWI